MFYFHYSFIYLHQTGWPEETVSKIFDTRSRQLSAAIKTPNIVKIHGNFIILIRAFFSCTFFCSLRWFMMCAGLFLFAPLPSSLPPSLPFRHCRSQTAIIDHYDIGAMCESYNYAVCGLSAQHQLYGANCHFSDSKQAN